MEKKVHDNNNLEVYIVDNKSEKFLIGRNLTKSIYHDKFKTTNIKDNYDLGIVMFYKGDPILNINIKIYDKSLPFLNFFDIPDNNKLDLDHTAFELSGLVMVKNEFEHSQYLIFYILYLIKYEISPIFKLKKMISIQHEYLINKLHNTGFGSFFHEVEPNRIKNESIPDDTYWSELKKPKLYVSYFEKNSSFIDKIEQTLINVDFI